MALLSIDQSAMEELAHHLADCKFDPLQHALTMFPWKQPKGPLERWAGPKVWQREVMEDIREHLHSEDWNQIPLQLAIASGHGIGKSALLGMLTNWCLNCWADCKILITANTEGQLRTKTSPEITKWCAMNLINDFGLFQYNTFSMHSTIKGHEKSWRCDLVPWSITNTDSFQGLHNEGKIILIIFDEAAGVDDEIWDVTQGALTDEDTVIIWLSFGNPTRAKGWFRECFRKYSADWKTRHIDSRDVEGTNKRLFAKWAKARGENSDFFKVRVRGMFPSASATQFYNTDLVDEARGKHLREDQYSFAPLILTCDPAWTGDDQILIGYRQGLYHKILEKIDKNNNDVTIANKLMRYEDELNADAVFIDQGWGQGIFSVGSTNGRTWHLIAFGSASGRADCVNKRAEMLVSVRDWLEEGGAIDPDDDLFEELIFMEVLPTMDGKYKFPDKDTIRQDLGRSPNCLDQLALTFALPIAKKRPNAEALSKKAKDYRPHSRLRKR